MLVLNFLISSVTVFLPPARAALLPEMVGPSNLLRANARLASIRGAAQLLAPAVAGSVLVRTGVREAFLLNSLSYCIPALVMAFIVPLFPRARLPAGAAGCVGRAGYPEVISSVPPSGPATP